MDNSKTHKKCSITINRTETREFMFLVPNHLVDEEEDIEEKVLEEIEWSFRGKTLRFDDLYEEESLVDEIHVSCPMIEGETTPDRNDPYELPIFGEKETK